MKKALAMFLAVLMVLSTLPVTVFAEEPVSEEISMEEEAFGEIPEEEEPETETVPEEEAEEEKPEEEPIGEEIPTVIPGKTIDEEIFSEEAEKMEEPEPLREVFAVDAVNAAGFEGGSGTEQDPYVIINEEQLDNVRNYLDACFVLGNDIILTSNWTPIGTDTSPFTGNFDGVGHVIKELNIDSEDKYVGLFGYNKGKIKNLGIVGGTVKGTLSGAYAGGIVGYNEGTISNCYNTGSVNAETSAGGIVGHNEGTISNCYNTGSVTSRYAGGIAGSTLRTISFCHNMGEIMSSEYAGGIAGSSGRGTIGNCYNIGDVNANSSSFAYAGGIAGDNTGYTTIKNCYNTGDVSAKSSSSSPARSGGIAGYDSATISNCYSIGNVSAVSTSSDKTYAGGIVGYRDGDTISNCYYLNTTFDVFGNRSRNGSGTTALSESQMKTKKSFAGFDFINTWIMAPFYSYPYPQFRNMKTETIVGIEYAGDYSEEISVLEMKYPIFKVEITWENNKIETVDSIEDMIPDFDPNKVGLQEVYLKWDKAVSSKKIKINVTEKSVESVIITKLPTKLIYKEGESFDYNGLKVTVKYDNGETEVVTPDSIICEDPIKGINTVTVNYKGVETTFDLLVYGREETIVASGYCGGDTTAGYDEESGAYKNLFWSLTDDGTLTIIGEGKMTNFKGYLYMPWYDIRNSLKRMVIVDGVTSIGNCAFYGCSNLTGEFILPDSVTSIGDWSFCYCSGFTGNFVIPENVTNIGMGVFLECTEYRDVYFRGNAPKVEKAGTDRSSFDPNVTLHYLGEKTGWSAPEWNGYRAYPIEFVLPDGAIAGGFCGGDTSAEYDEEFGAYKNLWWTLDDEGALAISGKGEMKDYSPDAAAPWNEYKDQIDQLVIEEGVTSIGDCAFFLMNTLTGTLKLPDSISLIGNAAFCGTGFSGELVLPKNLTIIRPEAFEEVAFSGNLVVPEGTVEIDSCAFYGCGFSSVTLPKSLRYIEAAFAFCYDIEEINMDSQSGFRFENGMIMDKDKTIVYECLSNVTDFMIPETVTVIRPEAFIGCTCGGDSIVFPKSLRHVCGWAFAASTVKNFYFKSDALETVLTEAFPEDATLYYIEGKSGWTTPTWNGYKTETWDFVEIVASGYCGGDTTAEYDSKSGAYKNLTWTLDSKGVLTISGEGQMTNYSSCGPWNKYKDSLKELVIEEGVTSIGNYAFYNFAGFTGDLVIPDSVISIGSYAFYQCTGFTGDLVIGDSVTSIGDYAFYNCGFTGKLVIPDSVTSIGDFAFFGCSGKIYFEGDAPTISSSTFNSGKVLKYIYGKSGWTMPTYSGYTTQEWTEGFKEKTDTVGFGYCGENGGTGLNWRLDSKGVLTISGEGKMADYTRFSNMPWNSFRSSLKKLVIEDGVTDIGNYAFYNFAGFTGDLVIPDSVISIGSYAFYQCTGFTGDLVIGDSVISIGDYAFYGCSGFTGDLVIGDSVISIGNYAFYNCSGFTGDLVIPDSVTSIGNYAFNNCSKLGGVYFEGDAPTISSSAFNSGKVLNYIYGKSGWTTPTWNGYKTAAWDSEFKNRRGYCGAEEGGTNLTWMFDAKTGTLTISGEGKMKDYGSYSSMPWYSVQNSIKKLVIEKGVTSIGNYAFYKFTGFTGDLVIPDSVTSIGDDAFYGCTGFTGDLAIPDSVTSIGSYAFNSCSNLGDIYFEGDVPTIASDAFLIRKVLNYIQGKSGWTMPKYNVYTTQEWTEGFKEKTDTVGFGYCGENGGTNLTWRLDSKGVLTISGEGKMANYTYSSSKTDAPWYNLRDSMEKLIIEEGVTGIGNYAFYNFTGFTGDLVIPDSVTSIGNYAFYNCSGFTGDLVIPDSVTSIGNYAFNNCSKLGGVYFEGDAPTIGSGAFNGGKVLNYLQGKSRWTMPTYKGFKTQEWTEGFKEKTDTVGFGYCGENGGTNLIWRLDSEGVLTISGEGKMKDYGSYYSVPWYSLWNSLKKLVIGDGVTGIGNYAFYGCDGFMGALVIPDSVTSIGDYAFDNCTGFTGDLVIPEKVTSIGSYAFYSCNGSAFFKGKAPTISSNAFTNGKVLNYIYGKSGWTTPTYSGYNTLSWDSEFKTPTGFCGAEGDGTNLAWIFDRETGTLSVSGEGKMANYTYPSSKTDAPWYNLRDSMEKLIIEEGVTGIGNYAFYNFTGFTGDLVIGDSVTSIGNYAFYKCTGFTGNLVIPDSVTSIGNSAFYNCSGFTGDLVIPDSVTSIGNSAFYNCSGFTGNLVIPDSVTNIGVGAFEYCSGFTGNLIIGDSVTTIGYGAFEYCSGFTGDLVIPDSVTSIGNHAFEYCSGFTGDLVIPDSVTTIGNYAFYHCSGFTGDLVIPDRVTSIGDYAFDNCTGFTGNLVIPDSVTSIGKFAFYNCTGFTGDLVIPDSVTTIENYAFYRCSGFTGNLVIPDSVTSIGDYAFTGCNNLGNIYFEGNAPTVGSEAFNSDEVLHYLEGKSGWTTPTWNGYKTEVWKIVVYGDVNNDGDINVIDANLVRRAAAKALTLDEDEKKAADVDGNGSVNVIDANLIRRYAAKLITKFPVEG